MNEISFICWQLDMKIIKQTVREVVQLWYKDYGSSSGNFFFVLCLPAPDGQGCALDDGYSGDSSFGGGIGPLLLWLDLPHQYPDGPGGEGLARKKWVGRGALFPDGPAPGLLRWLILAVLVVVMGLTMGREVSCPLYCSLFPWPSVLPFVTIRSCGTVIYVPLGFFSALRLQWAPVGAESGPG